MLALIHAYSLVLDWMLTLSAQYWPPYGNYSLGPAARPPLNRKNMLAPACVGPDIFPWKVPCADCSIFARIPEVVTCAVIQSVVLGLCLTFANSTFHLHLLGPKTVGVKSWTNACIPSTWRFLTYSGVFTSTHWFYFRTPDYSILQLWC
jgi:hypothetical protein